MDFNPSACVDLHIHSTASDGTLTPSEILELADDLKLGAISITDHDTLDGSRQAIANGIPDTLGFLTGVEISTRRPSFLPGKGSKRKNPRKNLAYDVLFGNRTPPS